MIRDRETAQLALQQAHDQLEERVKERTAQLKFQITARKESELQFKAILKERTRLAQELHDTVEQTLTGIALQLDTTSKLFEARPEGASHHLELARNLVSQSQVDVRRSVWDLRSRALEQFDLPGALVDQRQTTHRRHQHPSRSVRQRPRASALRNHGGKSPAHRAGIADECHQTFRRDDGRRSNWITARKTSTLQIQDNGHGFEQDKSAGPSEGHFGLLGISERAKRLGGELAVSSEPGRGTTVRIQVPIEQNSPVAGFRGVRSCTMKDGAKIRILVADDHFVVRMGLTALVNTEPDLEVVGEAVDGAQAVTAFEKHKPDLVLMDLRMPVKDGIWATAEIKSKHPNARVLMLTTFDGDTDIHRAMEAGAQGYVLKNSTGDKLIPALRAVAAGQRWIPKEIATRLASRNLFEDLTPRELQVLEQMAKGLANKEIADVLKITGPHGEGSSEKYSRKTPRGGPHRSGDGRDSTRDHSFVGSSSFLNCHRSMTRKRLLARILGAWRGLKVKMCVV